MSDISWILFDLGGVLVEIEHERIFASIASVMKTDPAKVKAKIYAEPALWHHFIRNEWSDAHLTGEVNRLLGSTLPQGEVVAAFNRELGSGIESTIAVLPNLLERVHVGCLSNTNSIHWRYLHETFSFMKLFEVQFASQELGAAKPDSEIYQIVEQRLDVVGREILFFDDRFENVEAARGRGWSAYLYSGHESLIAALGEHGFSM